MHYKFSFLLLALVIMTFVTADLFAGIPASALEIGESIVHFTANDQDGNLWQSQAHIGKKNLVVYFYPAAMTGGCTKQACSYRDFKSDLESINADVVGISGDPVSNLRLFTNMYNLNFTLLSDVNGEIARIFGVPTGAGGSITRNVAGKDTKLDHSVSISRWTFIFNQAGNLIYKDTEVNAERDSEKVLQFLKNLEKQ